MPCFDEVQYPSGGGGGGGSKRQRCCPTRFFQLGEQNLVDNGTGWQAFRVATAEELKAPLWLIQVNGGAGLQVDQGWGRARGGVHRL